MRGVARKNPQSGVGLDGTTLNVGNDIVREKPRHPGLCPVDTRGVTRKRSLDDELELSDSSSDVGRNIGSRIEQSKVVTN